MSSRYGWDDPYRDEKEALDRIERARTSFRAKLIKKKLAKTQFDTAINKIAIEQCGRTLDKCNLEEVEKLIEWVAKQE